MNTQMIENQDQKLSSRFPTEAPNEAIESQTQKIPNLVFMGLAGASILGSIVLAVRAGRKTDVGNFVGHWAPTFLLLGVYNKLVKIEAELLKETNAIKNLH